MGMFKDLKKSVTDMKDMTAAAPGMIQQANQLRDGAAMQQAAAQQQADAIMAQAGVAAGSNTSLRHSAPREGVVASFRADTLGHL